MLRFGTGAVPGATVTRLAAALGLSGTTARHAHGVVVDSTGGTLRVRDGGAWSYTRHDELCPGQQVDVDSPDLNGVAASCAVGPDTAAAKAKAPRDPKATAAPVLDAAGVGSTTATVDAYGDEATVSVAPVVGGAATVGLTTAVVVDAQGVRSAYGVLGEPSEGPAYPLISAAQGLDQLRAAPRPEIAISCPLGSTCPGVGPQRITGASLGLMVAWDGGEQILVPAWLYDVDASTVPLPVVAVADRYLADPDPGQTGDPGSSGGGSSGSAIPPGEPATPEPAPRVRPPPADRLADAVPGHVVLGVGRRLDADAAHRGRRVHRLRRGRGRDAAERDRVHHRRLEQGQRRRLPRDGQGGRGDRGAAHAAGRPSRGRRPHRPARPPHLTPRSLTS